MKAMIFAAGLGTRLRPITDSIPKALVEICGITMLERVLRKTIDSGVSEIVVNVHHFPDQVIKFLDSLPADIHIRVSDERDKLLDTGGGLKKAIDILGTEEPVLVHNADILTDFSLTAMYEFYHETRPDALLMVSERKSSRCFLIDERRKMRGWKNRTSSEVKPRGLDCVGLDEVAFGGVHILSPELLRDLYGSNDEVFSITPYYIEKCKRFRLLTYRPSEEFIWFDIGKPETLNAAREYMKKSSKAVSK